MRLVDRLPLIADRERVLRHEAFWSTSHNSSVDPLKNFSIVGATSLDLNARYDNDPRRIHALFQYLRKTNLPIAHDFVLDGPDQSTNQRNYLNERNTADFTLISYVGNYHYHDRLPDWEVRLLESKSKLIASICEGGEINLNAMPGLLRDYVPLGRPNNWETDSTVLPDLSFTTSQRWQMMGHKDYVAEAYKTVSGTHMAVALARQGMRLDHNRETARRAAPILATLEA